MGRLTLNILVSFAKFEREVTGVGAPFSVSRTYAITVAASAIVLSPTTVPAGRMGVAYSQTLSAGDGVAPYSFALTAGALPAGLTLGVDGQLSGTPTANGSFTFTVTATDSAAGAGPYAGAAAYTLVIAAPDLPVAGQVSAAVAYGSSDNPITPVLSSGTATSVAIATPPSHCSATVSGLGFLYTPQAGYPGPDSFTFTARNDGETSAPATVSLTVGLPPAPTTTNRSGVAVPNASTGVAIDLTASVSGVRMAIAMASAPTHGSVSVSGEVATYVPNADYFGPDSFTFTATGLGGTSAPSTVSLTVATPPPPVIEPPTAPVVVPLTTGAPTPVTVELTPLTDGVTQGYRVSIQARFGQAEVTAATAPMRTQSAGSVSPSAAPVYRLTDTPAANFMGTDMVSVVAFGPGGESAPATFTFQVAGKAPDLSGQVLSNGSIAFTPTSGLVGGPFNGLRITRAPGFGAATVDGLTLTFTPGAAKGGSTSLD